MPQWLGGPELIVIVLIIVILFGWKKLPDAARSLGRSMRIFKAEVEEMKRDDPPSAASKDTVRGATVPPQDRVGETPEQRDARIRAEAEATVRAEYEAEAARAAEARVRAEEEARRAAEAARGDQPQA